MSGLRYRWRVLSLGPRARVVFAGFWIAGQVALILSAARRSDHTFGFRMFPEASTMEIRLFRQLQGGLAPTPHGEWNANDAQGQLRHFSWRDRVRDPDLSRLDERGFASYGVDTQLARLQRALDDVADHVPEDGDTIRFRADVLVWRNGRDPAAVTLESHPRRLR
jgi:hypothetical protein